MLIAKDWEDFELIKTGAGEKLERWGEYYLRRTDGQVIWPLTSTSKEWEYPDALYHRSSEGGGNWEFKKQLPKRWTIKYKHLKFFVEPTNFKHTGLFPEQAVNWDWTIEILRQAQGDKKNARPKVLNLFGYTGAASVACASAGADVTHVDASKGINTWAKENYELNKTSSYGQMRLITDDVMKFIEREIRRGNKYDGIIMDPPVYGRGPKGELWELEKNLSSLIEMSSLLLSKDASFFLVNTYTASFSHVAIFNCLKTIFPSGKIESGEIGLETRPSKPHAPLSSVILPCGIYGRWSRV